MLPWWACTYPYLPHKQRLAPQINLSLCGTSVTLWKHERMWGLWGASRKLPLSCFLTSWDAIKRQFLIASHFWWVWHFLPCPLKLLSQTIKLYSSSIQLYNCTWYTIGSSAMRCPTTHVALPPGSCCFDDILLCI